MAIVQALRTSLAKFGRATGFVTRQVIAHSVPGGRLVADLLDCLLECAQQSARDDVLQSQLETLASEAELQRVGGILEEMNGRLGHLSAQVAQFQGQEEIAQKLIDHAFADNPAMREAFANVASLASGLDRLENQNRAILEGVHYGHDLVIALMPLMQQQHELLIEFVAEARTEGEARQAELAEMRDCLERLHEGQVQEVLPRLQTLETGHGQSASIQHALAIGAVLTHDRKGVERALSQATRLRPVNHPFTSAVQQATRSLKEGETPVSKSPEVVPVLRVGDNVEGWQLTQVLGQGGFGSVFRAEREGHVRALKALHPELGHDPAFVDHFKQEILHLCNLPQTQHLVKFASWGKDDRTRSYYFLMELIEGESLQTRLDRDGVLSLREAVDLIRAIAGAEGLGAAHQKGLVHRDIKPGNILIRSDGTPVLVDFGLALASSRGVSTIHRLTGYTAQYASPEQLRGEEIDARSDVWSLVATLFTAVTGKMPSRYRPSELEEGLAPLRDVFQSGLSQYPEDRFENSLELTRILADGIVSEAAVVIKTSTEATPKVAVAGSVKLRNNVALPDVPPGRRDQSGTTATEISVLQGHPDTVNGVAISPNGKLLASASDDNTIRLWQLPEGKQLATLQGHTNSVNRFAISSDGRLLASASDDKTIRLWQLPGGKHLATLQGHTSRVNGVAFSPDCKLLTSASDDKTIRLWQLPDGKDLATLQGHSSTVYSVAISPDGKLLVSASIDSTIRLWQLPEGKHLATLQGHSSFVFGVAISPDGKLLASASKDKTIRLWQLPEGKHLATLQGHTHFVLRVVISPDGKLLASTSHDKTIRLWQLPEGKHLATLQGHMPDIAFTPDGKLLAGPSDGGTFRLWYLHGDSEAPDFSFDVPALAPKPRARLTLSGDGVVYPGDHAWTKVSLHNTGKGDLIRCWAQVNSPSPLLDGQTMVFGRVAPSEVIERCVATVLPLDTPSGPLQAEVIFHEENDYTPGVKILNFNVHPLPRPDFPLVWELEDESTEEPLDSCTVQPGQTIDVVVTIRNKTGEDLPGLALTLRTLDVPEGVHVSIRRDDLGDVADESEIEGRVTFTVAPNATLGVARFELRAETSDDRTFAVVEVEAKVSN